MFQKTIVNWEAAMGSPTAALRTYLVHLATFPASPRWDDDELHMEYNQAVAKWRTAERPLWAALSEGERGQVEQMVEVYAGVEGRLFAFARSDD